MIELGAALEAARGHLAAPAIAGLGDGIEIVAGEIAFAADGGGRRHAERGICPGGAVEHHQRMNMIVPMQHEFGAVPPQHVAEFGGIHQALEAVRGLGDRRMMDQDHAEQPVGAEPVQKSGQRMQLLGSDLAGGHERARW